MTWTRSDLSRRHVRRRPGEGGCPWTKEDIRHARQVALKPVLESLGYRLEPLKNGNYIISGTTPETCPATGGIIIKDHYWICTATGVAGNAIDFLVKIRGVTFNQAIRLLLSDTAGQVQLLREPGAS